jgi:hypothetical protein
MIKFWTLKIFSMLKYNCEKLHFILLSSRLLPDLTIQKNVYIWVTQRVPYKKQERLTIREQLSSPTVFCITHFFSFLCSVVFCFLHLVSGGNETYDFSGYEKAIGTIKNGQSRDIGNIGGTKDTEWRQTKQKNKTQQNIEN